MNVAWPARERRAHPTTPPLVRDFLGQHGAAVRHEMDAFLARQPDAPFLMPLVRDYPARRAKMMRAGLVMAAAGLGGARPACAARAAAAVELFHNGLLIHDDIEDHSEERRGGPTLQALHGVPLALNAGDATLMLAIELLVEACAPLGERVTAQAVRLTLRMARETAEGQALELGWRDCNVHGLSDQDYMTMVLKKTAWMSVIWPLQLGLLLGGRGLAHPDGVARFGFFLGAAFQVQDDLLNFVADPAYGKERLGDLYEGKRTLMLIHLDSRLEGADRALLRGFLGRPRAQRTVAEAEAIEALMHAHGSVAHGEAVAGALAGAAAHEHQRCFGHLAETPERAFLAGLVPWVFERT